MIKETKVTLNTGEVFQAIRKYVSEQLNIPSDEVCNTISEPGGEITVLLRDIEIKEKTS